MPQFEYERFKERAVTNKEVLLALSEVSKFAIAQRLELTPERHQKLCDAIGAFSQKWRAAEPKLSAINKIHLFEAHVIDFVEAHGTWGLYSEQSK